MYVTSVSAGRLVGVLCLNRSDSWFGLFVLVGILLIPPHTQNINQHSASLHVD
jgi:hypothetical protein